MDRQDIRSVLRLFAEIASSINHDEGSAAADGPDAAQGGEESVPTRDEEGWVSSSPSAVQA